MTDKNPPEAPDAAENLPSRRGPIAWMARNRVAANALIAVLLLGGLLMLPQIRQEVFPEAEPDVVIIMVPYPGASPEEVEQGVILAVEEEVRGVDGVNRVSAVAVEGMAQVIAELFRGTDRNRAFNDILNAVQRITTFPEDAEEPVVSLPDPRVEVISMMVFGDVDPWTLHHLGEEARMELLRDERITAVEVSGLPPPEIQIEAPHEQLRRYNLTLQQIAGAVGAASVDLPGGGVRAARGEVLVRTTEERRTGQEFKDIMLLSLPDGSELRLGDIARVRDGFRATDESATYNGLPALRLRVFRIGDQRPLEVAAAAREFTARWQAQMPAAVGVALWNDYSEIYSDRVGLLVEKGALGLALVLLVLGVFLHPRLAFWVALGVAASFAGAFLLMPALGVSINMISLFAFILVLGIVVDDAIVVGEAAHEQSRRGLAPVEAAIAGAREVATPVTFAVLSTMVAFVPMMFVPGVMGDFFLNIPLIVIPILFISLVESFLVLPAHLSISKGLGDQEEKNRLLRPIQNVQNRISAWLQRFIRQRYVPFARTVIRLRYLTAAISLAVLLVAVGLVAGGRVNFVFFTDIEGDAVRVSVEMPAGTPAADTRAVVDRVVQAAGEALEEFGGMAEFGRGIYAEIGRLDPEIGREEATTGAGALGGGHQGGVSVLLVPAEMRGFGTAELSQRIREILGDVAGPERILFEHRIGPAAGAQIALRVAHDDREMLEQAAQRLAAELRTYAGVRDIDDGLQAAQEQLNLRLKPEARALGVTERELAMQVRAAFHGAEAPRQQRDRHELRILARLPLAERSSEHSLETLLIRTGDGGEIPLGQAAFIGRERSFTEIRRENGRRALEISADADVDVVTPNEVVRQLQAEFLPRLKEEIRGLTYERAGLQEEQDEAINTLARGLLLAMIVVYGMMAVVFRSYWQPMVVLIAVPFGMAGAVAGHLLLGFDMSIISMFGIVALAGVVVNDSLVLVYAINTERRRGIPVEEAIVSGSARRFRPVMLTSLTAFLGLAPLIFETSLQAKFLIPMAISLGFGVLAVTPIAMILVPALSMILEDILRIAPRPDVPPSD
jgi:multidrug efflux pump subunit AcrB